MDSDTGTRDVKVFDLTSPPSRAAVGLPDGKAQYAFQTDDHKPFPIKVSLPGGKQLAFDAKIVGVDAMRAPDPKTGAPTTMDIQFYAPTLEEGRDHLAAALSDFGLDAGAAQTWFTKAAAIRDSGKVEETRTPWAATKVGYLDLQLQGGYKSTGTAPGQTVIHYVFSWAAA
ncbi:hypothetical protein F4553_007509 [Allocatelliglobosispora scoriae]|uniref:Uncharacterized protein n=1 Tax=Allocatelliglobosispora scoriae TaxID=643052 RepID=A0A841C2C7_9ACTN|nr:hypothetical protein [Allocatelliglobosispora scoriae]MBB5874075.1 hypothetical protein [Allocatelliglobosispora scoriae]